MIRELSSLSQLDDLQRQYDAASLPALKKLRESLRRWSVDGDRLTRLQQWGARVCPPVMEPVLMFGYVSLLFVLFGRGRRAVQSNLRVILPGSSPLRNWFRAWKVFWNFGWTMTDAGRVRAGVRQLSWEIAGVDHFRELAEMEGGAILLTAHMGNYDIAGPTFAGKFNRKLNAVRAPERDTNLQAFYEKQSDRLGGEGFAVSYNAPGAMLGVELAQMLARGEVVALQGDRVMDEVAPVTAQVCGRELALPVGPHVLAVAGRAPIFPLFVIRSGWRRYRILSLPPQPVPVRERGTSRDEVFQRSAEAWAKVLGGVLRSHWDQWLEFSAVFQPGEEGR